MASDWQLICEMTCNIAVIHVASAFENVGLAKSLENFGLAKEKFMGSLGLLLESCLPEGIPGMTPFPILWRLKAFIFENYWKLNF